MRQSKTKAALERRIVEKQGHGFRNHLGASIVGEECARKAWYIWRWAKIVKFSARMLRLFDRGNLEESRIIHWLRDSGTHVVDKDPATGKQIRITDHNGHFGGSLDSRLFDAPDFPGLWVLGEYKTHAEKYFKELVAALAKKNDNEALKQVNVKYYAQAHIYMRYEELPYCLHFNVNKNNDDMEVLTIEYEPEVAERYIDRAYKIINSEGPPQRISETPGWFKCRWCDFKGICHEGEPKLMNCRTCIHSAPIENAQWLCRRYDYILSETEQRLGCQTYSAIPE